MQIIICSILYFRDGKGVKSRTILMNKLQSYLPPSVMLPPSRLNELLNQALELQALRCSHHNTSQGVALNTSSLLVDHCCPKSSFPMYTTQVSYFFFSYNFSL